MWLCVAAWWAVWRQSVAVGLVPGGVWCQALCACVRWLARCGESCCVAAWLRRVPGTGRRWDGCGHAVRRAPPPPRLNPRPQHASHTKLRTCIAVGGLCQGSQPHRLGPPGAQHDGPGKAQRAEGLGWVLVGGWAGSWVGSVCVWALLVAAGRCHFLLLGRLLHCLGLHAIHRRAACRRAARDGCARRACRPPPGHFVPLTYFDSLYGVISPPSPSLPSLPPGVRPPPFTALFRPFCPFRPSLHPFRSLCCPTSLPATTCATRTSASPCGPLPSWTRVSLPERAHSPYV